MTDFRALCAELVEKWDNAAELDDLCDVADVMDRTRAALAQPEPQGPTDEELESFLVDVACQNGNMYHAEPMTLARAVLARWGRPAIEPVPDHVNLIAFAYGREPWATWLKPGGCLESAHCELSELLLAVLARWGRPAIEPVPVAERLPGPEDLTDEHFGVEWCWWGKRFAGGWEWHQGGTGYGTMPGEFSYWLPHHALQVPPQEANDD